ncbi:MAG: chloride channel protein [candidate division Zixibacteria bacterium]|nr:chloride channel protein [candidate division Zixibacteria bacterium]
MNRFQGINRFFNNIFEKTRYSENMFIIGLSIVVGLLTGLGAMGFRWLILTSKSFFFGSLPEATTVSGLSSEWFTPLIPMLGGLLVGPIVYKFASEAKGHGVPEVMSAVALKGGVIRPRVSIAKSIASAICIGSGGSAGREGPIVQIGSAIGSTIGQMFRLSGNRVKVLVGCGAAAGISAVFNAPIAGVIFALEVILGDFTIKTFSPVILSSVIASVVSRSFLGNSPAFAVPEYALVSAWEVPMYMLLGVFTGVVSFIFIKALYFAEDLFDGWKIPNMIKPAIGGLLLGLLGLKFPQVFADGYEAVSAALHGEMVWTLMLVLVIGKVLATSFTLGSGNSGGIFAPSLFMGAMAGGFFGSVMNYLFPEITAPAAAYALVGMGAVVAGATHATITSIIIVFEMTGDYRIILPMMIATVFATQVALRLNKDSIYTLKLSRKGIRLKAGRDVDLLSKIKVAEVMDVNYQSIPRHLSLTGIMRLMDDSTENTFPVTDSDKLYGILSFQDLRSVLIQPVMPALIIASDIATREVITITIDDNLNDALQKFGHKDLNMMPVVDKDDPTKLLGVLRRGDVMAAYNKRLVGKMAGGG